MNAAYRRWQSSTRSDWFDPRHAVEKDVGGNNECHIPPTRMITVTKAVGYQRPCKRRVFRNNSGDPHPRTSLGNNTYNVKWSSQARTFQKKKKSIDHSQKFMLAFQQERFSNRKLSLIDRSPYLSMLTPARSFHHSSRSAPVSALPFFPFCLSFVHHRTNYDKAHSRKIF